MIIKLVSPHASLIGQTGWALAIFAVAALPGFILAAFTIDRIGRKLLPAVGLGKTSALVAGVSLLGLLATLALLPEPKGTSLEEFTEDRYPTSAVAVALAESRGTRPPSA